MEENTLSNSEPRQTIVIKQEPRPTNPIGTAGFVLALVTIFLGWVPILGWIMGVLGFIFSFIGLFKAPRGLAIAGFIISIIGFLFLMFFFAAIAGAAMLS